MRVFVIILQFAFFFLPNKSLLWGFVYSLTEHLNMKLLVP